MTMPEFIVYALGKGMYGILRENSLLVPNLIGKVSDGTVTKAEMTKLNKKSEKMAEEAGIA